MGMNRETLFERNRENILRFVSLVNGGMSLQQALLEIYPNDSNRARSLKTWKKYGLLLTDGRAFSIAPDLMSLEEPVTATEPQEAVQIEQSHETSEPLRSEVTVSIETESAPLEADNTVIHREQTEPVNAVLQRGAAYIPVTDAPISISALSADNAVTHRSTPEDDIAAAWRLLKDIKVVDRGITWKGKTADVPTKFIGARIPVDLVQQVEELGRPLSNHVEKALRLYLMLVKARADK